ncbi:MAG TPA: amidohydrolase [Bacteroidia bacterium]|nr:amidohydrolase [Bacteroidia bacterium]
MSDLTLSLVQSTLYWEAPEKNRNHLEEKILSIDQPTDLVILPEMFNTGFSMNAKDLAEPMNGVTMEWMHRLAEKTMAVITGSIIIKEENNYFNRLIWMLPNGSYNHYDKRHLFTLAQEEKTFSAGNHQWIMPLNGWLIFPLICYDLRFPVFSRRNKTLEYDLLIYVANWPERRKKAWNQLLIARAIENQCYVAGVNRVGIDGNEINYSGNSAIIDFKGDLLSELQPNVEMCSTVTLNKPELMKFRSQYPFGNDADNFTINY